jgi:hypothetical protein
MFRELKPNERFKHSITSTTLDGVETKISEDGIVTLTKRVEGFVAPGEEYDEIELKAGTIFKIAQLLRNTRFIVNLDEVNK